MNDTELPTASRRGQGGVAEPSAPPAITRSWLFPAYARSTRRRYAVAVLLAAAGLGLVVPLSLWADSVVVSVPVLAVLVSGWYGGLGPAIATAAICGGVFGALIAFDGASTGRGDVIGLILYFPVAVLSGVLSDAARRALLVSRELAETQRQLLQAVLKSEQQWRALAESMPALVSTADAVGNVTFCNRAFLEYLGISREELEGLQWSDNVHPDDREAVVRQYESAVASGDPATAELRMRRHGGEYRWFLGHLSPIRDGAGTAVGWVGASVEIQDRKDAEVTAERARAREAELRQKAESRESYYRALFDSSSDAILVADAEGRYIDANRAAGAFVGRAASDLVGMQATELVAAAPEWTDEEYRKFMETGTWRGEVELRHASGGTIAVEAAATRIELEGGPIGISALRDVSERRRFDELRQRFLASVSHELRNVLTPILGNAQLLARLQRFDALSVEAILDQARRLERIIADLTDTASAEAGRFEVTRAEGDLVDLVRRAMGSFRDHSDRHSIVLVGDESPVYGAWDGGRLQQVFENLLSNAIKYSPDGGDVEVTIRRLPDEVEVSVRDHGIGLSSDDTSRLFEPFVRAVEAQGSGISGFGLGLHVVKLIVEAHGGVITARSEGAMEGTRFDVRLPYK